MFFEKRSINIRGQSTLGVALGNGINIYNDDYVSAESAIRNSDVWAAVNVISSDLARIKLSTESKKINKLLLNPSRIANRFNFIQSLIAQMLLTGNAYAVRRTDSNQEFWEFVRPSNVTVNLSDDGQTITYDVSFIAPDEPDLKNIDSADMIHFKCFSMDGGLMGKSPLAALSSELELQKSSRNLAVQMFRQAINPMAILKSNKAALTEEAKKNVRASFEKANSGSNAGRVLILDPLFDFNQLEIKTDVAKLLNSVDWTRDQIAKVFMLPTDILGNESEHSNADQIRNLYNTTLGRYLASIVEEIEAKLDVQIIADVKQATDLDGIGVEQRVNEMVKAGTITTDMALAILADSQSDLVTQEIVNKVSAKEVLPNE